MRFLARGLVRFRWPVIGVWAILGGIAFLRAPDTPNRLNLRGGSDRVTEARQADLILGSRFSRPFGEFFAGPAGLGDVLFENGEGGLDAARLANIGHLCEAVGRAGHVAAEPQPGPADAAVGTRRFRLQPVEKGQALFAPRRNPPRVELSRLTTNQYRSAVADLIATFLPQPPRQNRSASAKPDGGSDLAARGLRGEFFSGGRHFRMFAM